MKAGHIELPVKDPVRSMKFYTEVLGFKLDVNQDNRFIWLTSNGYTLLLRSGKPVVGEFNASPNICLYVADSARVARNLAAHGVQVLEHSSCFHFRDQDGHWFQLANPGEDHSQDAASDA
ncbi:MAG: hypothetical protein HPKKFMNG_02816 [Planctomycetes bacterium]|nr:hypothetical protein [Planctomycetota bacterium]HRJ79895.1 VOC family protein [Planctomycetota bacterium]